MCWTCQGVDTIDAPLFIMIYNTDGSIFDPGTQTSCKASGPKTTGETEEHSGGTVYLNINSGIDWTITIQELK